jgi:hypothetical protein
MSDRLTQLEQDANFAGRDAIQSRKNGMSQLEEVLANLDATEFRLERAEDDVHIAQSYMLRYGIYANRVACSILMTWKS